MASLASLNLQLMARVNRTRRAGLWATFQRMRIRFAAARSRIFSASVTRAAPPLTWTSITVSSSGARLFRLMATRSIDNPLVLIPAAGIEGHDAPARFPQRVLRKGVGVAR